MGCFFESVAFLNFPKGVKSDFVFSKWVTLIKEASGTAEEVGEDGRAKALEEAPPPSPLFTPAATYLPWSQMRCLLSELKGGPVLASNERSFAFQKGFMLESIELSSCLVKVFRSEDFICFFTSKQERLSGYFSRLK